MAKNRGRKPHQQVREVPRAAAHGVPAPGKDPRVDESAMGESDSKHPAWRFAIMDLNPDGDGDWGWDKITPEELRKVHERLANYEKMSWREIKRNDGQGCHSISVERLPRETQKRLEAIQQDDADALFSLRINQKARVWGIRDLHVLRILWWDPEHTVYPVNVANN